MVFNKEMTEKSIGKWKRDKGNILVNIPDLRGRKKPFISKYLGGEDDPFSPVSVERDIYVTFKIKVRLVPKTRIGGVIVLVEGSP
jgi:hypothetical protein